jgi:two-component system sensor histidine kinase MprB
MRLGFSARLAILFALLVALTALLTGGFASASTDRRIKDNVDQFLRERALDIAEGRRRPQRSRPDDRNRGNDQDNDLLVGESDSVDGDSVERAVEADAVVQVLDSRGVVIARTGIALPVSEADISMASDRAPVLLRTETINGEPFRMATMTLGGGDGAVQVAQSLESTNLVLGEIRSQVIVASVALSALAGLIGWAVASGTTRPLRRLTRSIEEVRETQDLTRPVALDRSDELGRLSTSFDELLQTLAASRDQQQQLVQDAAHELRTPLTSVRANIDFLQRAPNLDEETRTMTLASIRSELGELSDLLGEVVELATESDDPATFERIDLVTAAEAALAQFEIRSARRVERDMSSSFVMGNHAALTRAIGNLIGNADKYTPDAAAPIRVQVEGGRVMVADRGPGIPAEDRAKVFERFWRADEARSASGSGLGLAIVKKAVDDHRGTVFVHERLGGGAEIGFQLPTS